MELVKIQTQTSWGDAVNGINSNNQAITVEIRKMQNIANKNLGYFNTKSDLLRTYPTATDGCIAYVGYMHPFQIYAWRNGAWVATGEYGGSDINLASYITSEPVTTITEILDEI